VEIKKPYISRAMGYYAEMGLDKNTGNS